jgi:hypothetical protein
MFGLNDAHIAQVQPSTLGQGKAGHEKFDVRYTVDVVRPDIVVGANWVPGMIPNLLQGGTYALVPLPNQHMLVRKGLFTPAELRPLVALARSQRSSF